MSLTSGVTNSRLIAIRTVRFDSRSHIKKNALYLSANVFSTKVLIGDTIFTSPSGDRTTILHGHPSHVRV